MSRLKYIFGALASLPLLPIMYRQGKRIRREIPPLPEAVEPRGSVGTGRPLRLISIGESTIAGVGVKKHAEGFTGLVANTLAEALARSVNWRVYARSGYTTRRMIDKLLPRIEETDVDLVVIGTGGNDAFTLNQPWIFRRQIRELIETLRLRFPNTPIVFANMPPIKEFPAFTATIKFTIGNLAEFFGDELEAEVQQHDHAYYFAERITINTWQARLNIEAERDDFFSDGVHPSKLTYQAWGKSLAEWMLEQGIKL